MGPAQAIRTGFAKSFQFSGRASRPEFWWFAPFGFAPPLIGGLQMSWFNMDFWGIWRVAVLALLSLPLLAAMSRRLQDVGEPGHDALYPFMPFIMLWIGYQVTYWFIFGAAPLLGGIALAFGWIALVLFIPLYLFAIVVSLNLAATVIGTMIISSMPGPNGYGPNPFEVTP